MAVFYEGFLCAAVASGRAGAEVYHFRGQGSHSQPPEGCIYISSPVVENFQILTKVERKINPMNHLSASTMINVLPFSPIPIPAPPFPIPVFWGVGLSPNNSVISVFLLQWWVSVRGVSASRGPSMRPGDSFGCCDLRGVRGAWGRCSASSAPSTARTAGGKPCPVGRAQTSRVSLSSQAFVHSVPSVTPHNSLSHLYPRGKVLCGQVNGIWLPNFAL